MNKEFKVGDEVYDVTAPGTRAVVTRYNGEILYVVFCDGSCGEEDPTIFKKTGRRFKIKKILEELE